MTPRTERWKPTASSLALVVIVAVACIFTSRNTVAGTRSVSKGWVAAAGSDHIGANQTEATQEAGTDGNPSAIINNTGQTNISRPRNHSSNADSRTGTAWGGANIANAGRIAAVSLVDQSTGRTSGSGPRKLLAVLNCEHRHTEARVANRIRDADASRVDTLIVTSL